MAGETHASDRAHVEGLLGDRNGKGRGARDWPPETGAAADEKRDCRRVGPPFMKGHSACAVPM